MAFATPDPKYPTFSALYNYMKSVMPAPVTPPAKPSFPALSSAIAGLSLHPTLESALHILNNDLSSAHFLVRHMECAPAYEGMFLHGILHRIEGDYDNARAWYKSVAESDLFASVWDGGLEEAMTLIDRIEALAKRKEGDEDALEKESRREIDAVVAWCREKFGEAEVTDASGAWVKPDQKKRKMASNMIIGGEVWRNF